MSQWVNESGGGRPVHVYPVNDTREHVLDDAGLCPCLPTVLHVEGDDDLILHNAYDAREVGEVCRRALDGLAQALADHGHVWSDVERTDYEHAILLLEMHWPDKPQEMPRRGP